jgi:hypothetical protein
LAHQHPGTWEIARARHHAILREAMEQNDGFVFQNPDGVNGWYYDVE